MVPTLRKRLHPKLCCKSLANQQSGACWSDKKGFRQEGNNGIETTTNNGFQEAVGCRLGANLHLKSRSNHWLRFGRSRKRGSWFFWSAQRIARAVWEGLCMGYRALTLCFCTASLSVSCSCGHCIDWRIRLKSWFTNSLSLWWCRILNQLLWRRFWRVG